MDAQNLGPLPQADRNDVLDDLGLQALTKLFPVDRFCVRSEPGKDKGVDRYLEVKVDGNFTNLRSQVQLKSKEHSEQNTDGSVSKSIEVSNLNYILNGLCPMYVLYLADMDELRYAWARDEAARLNKENPDWMSAGSITIRFQSILSPSAFDDIKKRIMDESLLGREIHQRLIDASRSEAPKFQIDTSTGTVHSSIEAKKIIEESGTTIIASGYPSKIIELAGILSAGEAHHKRVQLVLAYAYYILSRYDLAMGCLRECLSISGNLTTEDNWLLKEIKNACNYKLGRQSKEEFFREEKRIAHEYGGIIEDYIELDELRYRHLAERNESERIRLMKEMAVLLQKIDGASSPVMSMSAHVLFLYSEGQEVVSSFLTNFASQGIQSKLPVTGMPDVKSQSEVIFESWKRWHTKAEELLHRTAKAYHPILFADAKYTRATVVASFLLNVQLASEIGWICKPDWFMQCATDAINDAENAVQIFTKADCLESSFRAQLTLADLYEVAGMPTKSKEIALQMLPVCKSMGYHGLTQQAEDIASGQSHLSRLRANLKQGNESTEDEKLINMNHEEIDRYTKELMRSMGLPSERFSNVKEEVLANRRIAIERRDWCSHLGLTQDLNHTRNTATAYARVPDFACVCTFRNIGSSGGQNWSMLIDVFKATVCAMCKNRLVNKKNR